MTIQNQFKKALAFCLACLLLCGLALPCRAADYTPLAEELQELGLFLGTDEGFALDKTLTREQAATMLVRLLGKEKEAAAESYTAQFTDVAAERWSFAYVMYCYENSITKGTGADTFSPEADITATEFLALVLRLLGYTDTEPETAYKTAVSKTLLTTGLVRDLEAEPSFLRNSMVLIAYRSLQTPTAKSTLLAQQLADQKVITQKQADALNIYNENDIDSILKRLLQM